jgi:lactoylglutathione lyase
MALIHTCYRITDIDPSVAFYGALGFQEVGRIPIKDEASNVFMNQPSGTAQRAGRAGQPFSLACA